VHFPFSIFFLIYLSLHISADIHAVLFLSYLVQHSMYDILPQLGRKPTVTINIQLYCYPTSLSHIIPIKLIKLSLPHRWKNIYVPCYQSDSCIISHSVTDFFLLVSPFRSWDDQSSVTNTPDIIAVSSCYRSRRLTDPVKEDAKTLRNVGIFFTSRHGVRSQKPLPQHWFQKHVLTKNQITILFLFIVF
jgi:hypothetical protein